jgi:hypothetical protein
MSGFSVDHSVGFFFRGGEDENGVLERFASKSRLSSLTISSAHVSPGQMTSLLNCLKAQPFKTISSIYIQHITSDVDQLIRLLSSWPLESLQTVTVVKFLLPSFHSVELKVRTLLIELICTFLQHCFHPMELHLSKCTFSEDELLRIISSINVDTTRTHSDTVWNLNLSHYGDISESGINSILDHLSDSLEVLHLYSSVGLEISPSTFSRSPRLTELHVTGKSNIAQRLFDLDQLPQMPCLTSLLLNVSPSTLITDHQTRNILKLPALINLTLNMVYLNSDEFPESPVEVFNVVFNRFTKVHTSLGLLKSLRCLKNLKVSFHDNPSNMSEVISFIIETDYCSKLESLGLGVFDLKDDLLLCFCGYLKSNSCLRNLSLPRISGSTESIAVLCEFIKSNRSLEKLTFQNLNWIVESFCQIADALSANDALLSINLGYHERFLDESQNEQVMKKIHDCLDTNHRLSRMIWMLVGDDEGIHKKICRNSDALHKESRHYFLRFMTNKATLPSDLLRVIFEMANLLELC